ncbi:hypothetical protein R9C00_21640 [Flammeovirgaceae bacterium SG7u.111]|nr:hypothetical protein [Flammeovirgaceae bacterium SG7u.132]WPO34305.1 hypothetical protein R9C00_21640 [Flammeovirgaceae bacterium SG7u.111]
MKIKLLLVLLIIGFKSFGQGLTGVIIINNDETVTNNKEKKVSLTIQAKGAKDMMISNNGSYTGARWEPYEPRKPYWRLGGEDGVKTIYAKFRDGDGNISETVTATIELDRLPPQDPDIMVNGGKQYTNNKMKVVQLELTTSSDDVVKMRVSNRNDFLGSPWVAYRKGVRAWKLSPMEGVKEIFAQYMDKAGNISALASAEIILDLTPPNQCKVEIEKDATYTNKKVVTVKAKATGASEMIVRGGEGWEEYKDSFTWELPPGDGKKEVFIKFRDAVGNQSSIVSDYILVDTEAPKNGLILVNNGSKYTRSYQDLHLKILATGATEMMISNDSTFKYSKWQGYTQQIPTWLVEDVDGDKTVFVKFRDPAGNESKVYSDDIILDKTPPSNPFIRIVTPDAQYDSIAGVTIISNDAKVVDLEISAVDGDYMMVSNVSTFYGAKWEKYKPKLTNWELGGNNDGDRAVFVKFRDRAGNVSTVATDKAVVDTQAPVDAKIMIDNNAEYCTDIDKKVKLQLFARGANYMMISNDPTFEGATWEPYKTHTNWKLDGEDGIKSVVVKFKDMAGNMSEPEVDNILLDRKPPFDCTIVVDKGNEVTMHPDKVVLVKVKSKEAKLMQISNSDDFKHSRWQSYSPKNFNWVLAGDDGNKQVFVRFKDEAGNISIPVADSIHLDRTPPKEGTIEIDEGSSITNNANKKVKLKLYAEDATTMRLGNRFDFKEIDGEAEWIPYAEEVHWTLTGPDGLKTVFVQFRDAIGNVSKTAHARIGIDRQAPKEGRITINRGAQYCTDVSGFVNLQLYAMEATHMMLSNSQNFDGAGWIKYEGFYQNWPLDGEDGEKKVYAKFKDEAENETSPIVASIMLDRQEPFGEELIINGGAEFTNDKTHNVSLELKAEDAIEMMVSNSPHFRGGTRWEKYKPTKNWTLVGGDGSKVLYVKFRDQAGNESDVANARITLDTEPPIAQYIKINNGATSTEDARVQLTLKARKAVYMKISNSPKFEGAIWEPYSATKEWDLEPTEGLKRVFVKYKDDANNESRMVFKDITLVNKF